VPLNIKDDVVHNQARELAELTGESITQVVRVALAERLASVKLHQNSLDSASKAKQLMVLAKLCAENIQPNSHSSSHADLYGEDGLPG
jgi:antitoxin VapB